MRTWVESIPSIKKKEEKKQYMREQMGELEKIRSIKEPRLGME